MHEFRRESTIPVSADSLLAWHARPGAFQRLVPPWDTVRVVEKTGGIEEGARLVMEVKQGPLWMRWVALHHAIDSGLGFVDEQLSGPFSKWIHTHVFEPEGDSSLLVDHIRYRLPLEPLSWWFGGRGFTATLLKRMFDFRHRRTVEDLVRHDAFSDRPRLKVAISGATGLIGTALDAFLTTGGHEVLRLVRRPAAGPGEVSWDPKTGTVETSKLEGVDAVVHLAGANVAGGRWTDERKAAIADSRTDGTTTLARALASLERKPEVFVSASAVGYYGDPGDAWADETTDAADDFLARVCADWEASADVARDAGIRVVHPRIGVVLSAGGGALAKMLTPFKLGAGGPVGSGDQWMSWVAHDDVVGALHHALYDRDLTGPVNVVSPNPIRQADFARVLGRVLRRPAIAPLPAFMVKTLFGEMGETLLLRGQRVRPAALENTEFSFNYPDLETALRVELGRE